MNVWEFLGITPTMDVKVIKRAYAKMLRNAHPEDDIAAFQTLQEAYQAALKEAQYLSTVAVDIDNENIDNTISINNTNSNVQPVESELLSTVQNEDGQHSEQRLPMQAQHGLPYSTHVEEDHFPVWFMEQIDALYDDFNSRIYASNWKALLEREELWAYENWTTVSNYLWEYLHGHYHLPQEIWRLLEQHFNWIKQRGAVNGTTDSEDHDFFEYYYYQIVKSWSYSYPMVPSEIDGDAFINLREHAREALIQDHCEAALHYLQEAQALFPNDFDLLRLYGEYHLRVGNVQEAGLIYERLVREFPYEESVMLQYGKFLIGEKRIKEAMKLYQDILAQDHDSTGAMTGIALCYQHYGQLQEAKAIISLIIEQNPSEVIGRIMLSDLNGQIIITLKGQLADNPNQAKLQYELAELYFETEQYGACCELLEQMEQSGQENSAIYLLWGRTQLVLEQYEASLELLKKAKSLAQQEGTNGYEIRVVLGDVLYHLEVYEEAQLHLTVAVEMNPVAAHVNDLLGAVYYRLGQYELAIQYCSTAIQLKPLEWSYYNYRAFTYYALERYQEALDDFNFILSQHRFYGYHWFIKGHCHLFLKQYESAADAFLASIDYLYDRYAYFNAAIAYVKMERYTEALTALANYNEHYNDVEAYILEGDIYRATGDFEKAWSTYCSGVELDPNSYIIVQRAVYTYMKFIFPRREEGVLDWLEVILNENPWDRWMATHMARILINLKMWKEVNMLTTNLFYECEEEEFVKELSSFYSGVAYYHRGNSDEAYFWLQHALSQNRNPAYLIYSSVVCLQLKKNKEALMYAEEAIQMVPHEVEYQHVYEMAKQANQGMMKKLLSKPTLSSSQLLNLELLEVQQPEEIDQFYTVSWR